MKLNSQKRISKLIIVSMAIFTLTGCATNFVHNSKNSQDFERDKYDCKIVASQYASSMGAAGNPLIIVDEMKQCLQYKHGWVPETK